jgi:uncharacterized protein YeaO (DUF488 family)
MKLQLKRAYESPAKSDGTRLLVDRLWPRGVSKDEAKIDHWLKEIAPSTALRKWFDHDPAKWTEFRKRYWRELDQNESAVTQLKELLHGKTITLIYGAKDTEHNHAVALKEYVESKRARP